MTFKSCFLNTLDNYTADLPTETRNQNLAATHSAKAISLGGEAFTESACLLNPIFQLNGNHISSKTFPVKKMDVSNDEFVFPKKQHGLEKDWEDLAGGFRTELREISHEEKGGLFAENLLQLTRQYFSHVGASPDNPFVSIYDHCRQMGALMDCMERADNQAKPFLLFAAGLNSIQSFCYNLIRNKAAKSIKGRSFYLQILMDVLAQRIVFDPVVNATTGHILFARGGKLRILLPNNKAIRARLEMIEDEVQVELYEKHKMALSMHMVHGAAFSKNDFLTGNVWPILEGEKVKQQKWQPNLNLLAKGFDFNNLFEKSDEAIDENDVSEKSPKICSVTSDYIQLPNKKNHLLNIYDEKEEEAEKEIWVTKYINDIAKLGSRLQGLDGERFYVTPGLTIRGMSSDEKSVFAKCLQKTVGNGLIKKRELNTIHEKSFIRPFNYFFDAKNRKTGFIYGQQFYGGKNQATKKEENNLLLKDFSDLAEYKEGGRFTRLAILRMDVDSLGSRLNELFAKDKSLGVYNAVSAQLDEFFSGYINTIRDQKKYRGHVNILFSGGDDLMAIGKWDLIIDFAEEVHKRFCEYFSIDEGNEAISLSAGITMVNPKFPISKANEDAEVALNKAKEMDGKNAVALFDLAVTWEEWEQVKGWKKSLCKYIMDQTFTSSLLQSLQRFYQTKAKHESDATGDTPKDKTFLFTSAYHITRYKKRIKKEKVEAQEFLEKMREEFFTALKNDARYYDKMALAARWAELELRSEKEKELLTAIAVR